MIQFDNKENKMIQFDNAVKRYGDLILTELKNADIRCWIAGGALRDYFAGVIITTDHDIFFPNEIEYEKAKTYFKEKNSSILWESDNGTKLKYNDKIFDLVKIFFPDPQATIDAFDFTVSMLAVDDKQIYHGETTFIDLAKRQLIFNKITYPASTLSRAFRYYTKGFLMCSSEMKKLVIAISEIPKQEENTANNDEGKSSGNNFFRGID